MIPTDPRPTAYPEWDDLTPGEQIEEVRKGFQSRYFADFEDDPTVLVTCEWCGGGMVLSKLETSCDLCGWDFDHHPHTYEPDCVGDLDAA